MKHSQPQLPPQVHHQLHEERDQQEQHLQPLPQQFDFPQPPPQNFPQEYNWQELTQQFQGMRVEQNNQFKDFFDRQNSFFEEMRTQTKAYKQGFEDMRVQQHKINSKNEQKIDYLCWGVQQVNPYLKGRLPEDIPEWMQANLQAGRGRFHDGMSRTPRDCWPGATSSGPASTSNEEDKGKGKVEEGDNDERGKKKAWEARDKDLNQ
ncbi:hypothetical protein PIB30_086488 [Stylosanthes scabra]|uniref:Uncharacterized protein n=1 Tax=Stylosanthes scabra TaxID=79078 RepID=A0ABU6YTF6_9FABA|nr:hypothetical protein [Stylosanthes scabra]